MIRNKGNLYYFQFLYYYYKNRDKNIRYKIKNIMLLNEHSIGYANGEQEEHAVPGMQKYISNGWYKYMFGRYLFCLKYIKNKKVLDTGCGPGWGSYLISGFPKKLIAVDIDENALLFAESRWNNGISFKKLSVLQLTTLKDTFDIVLGYEVIEHLQYSDGEQYIREISGVLHKDGIVVLSSVFPDYENEAQSIASRNKFHLHIYTKKEMMNLLAGSGFHNIRYYGDFVVTAVKL